MIGRTHEGQVVNFKDKRSTNNENVEKNVHILKIIFQIKIPMYFSNVVVKPYLSLSQSIVKKNRNCVVKVLYPR